MLIGIGKRVLMKDIMTILLKLEDSCKIRVNPPVGPYQGDPTLDQVRGLSELYEISNGLEINVPGTVIYQAEDVRKYSNSEHGETLWEIGAMNFGDILVMNEDGVIKQIDHESGEIFLTWDSLKDLLIDELGAVSI